MIIGIDATNIRSGGGLTHLKELLSNVKPEEHGIKEVIVWSSRLTLREISSQSWIKKIHLPVFEKGFLRRSFWQRYSLSKEAKKNGCELLFIPGGSFSGSFRPFVSMSQNLLPFELRELFRYRISLTTFRLIILRIVQTKTFIKSNGIIFLTEYAKNFITKKVEKIDGKKTIIPHGISNFFFKKPKLQKDTKKYSSKNPYKILYVSIIDVYKHQWHVVNAVTNLNEKGYPVSLDLIGPFYNQSLKKLKNALNTSNRKYINYFGEVPHSELHHYYKEADLFIFASSCENLPIILLEAMASGLPIICTNKGPMKDVIGESGVFFNPESESEIEEAIKKVFNNKDLRTELGEIGFKKAKNYSWEKCANDTFKFLTKFR